MKVEAFQAVKYACPNCGTENILRLTLLPQFVKAKCTNCGGNWKLAELMSVWEPLTTLPGLEWLCSCGQENFVGIVVRWLGANQKMIKGLPSLDLIAVQNPQFGLCENCGEGFDLEFPEPEMKMQ